MSKIIISGGPQDKKTAGDAVSCLPNQGSLKFRTISSRVGVADPVNSPVTGPTQDNTYFIVGEDSGDVKDVKGSGTVVPQNKTVTIPKTIHTLMNNRRMGGKVGKGFQKTGLKPIKTTLAWSTFISSSANTALNTVIDVDLLQSAEFSSWAGLYDLVKCIGGRVFFSFDSTGGSPIDIFGIIAYDPDDASAYNSVAAAMVATHNSGVKHAVAPITGSVNAPIAHTQSGMWAFKWKCPPVPQKIAEDTTTSLQNCTGMWASCNTGAKIKYGYLKPFIEAAGTSIVTAMHVYISVDVEFRSRT